MPRRARSSVTTGLAGDAWHGPASLAMTRGQPVCGVVEHGGGSGRASGRPGAASGERVRGDAGGHRVQRWSRPNQDTTGVALVAANLLGQNAPARSRPRS